LRYYVITMELSKREKEVLLLVGKAKTSKEIALELNISPRTVHFYLENAYFKLGVSGVGARQKAYNVALINNMLT
jgi:DNA-binding CsgD family transcriptional regulator